MRVTITRALILKQYYISEKLHFRNYDIGIGTYFLEKVEVLEGSWLCLEGLEIGLPLSEWLKILDKGVKPKSKSAKKFFNKTNAALRAAS